MEVGRCRPACAIAPRRRQRVAIAPLPRNALDRPEDAVRATAFPASEKVAHMTGRSVEVAGRLRLQQAQDAKIP